MAPTSQTQRGDGPARTGSCCGQQEMLIEGNRTVPSTGQRRVGGLGWKHAPCQTNSITHGNARNCCRNDSPKNVRWRTVRNDLKPTRSELTGSKLPRRGPLPTLWGSRTFELTGSLEPLRGCPKSRLTATCPRTLNGAAKNWLLGQPLSHDSRGDHSRAHGVAHQTGDVVDVQSLHQLHAVSLDHFSVNGSK